MRPMVHSKFETYDLSRRLLWWRQRILCWGEPYEDSDPRSPDHVIWCENLGLPSPSAYWLYRTYGYEGRKWEAYWYTNGLHFSLGIHICRDNIEVHLPCGFIRVGRALPVHFRGRGWQWGSKIMGTR